MEYMVSHRFFRNILLREVNITPKGAETGGCTCWRTSGQRCRASYDEKLI